MESKTDKIEKQLKEYKYYKASIESLVDKLDLLKDRDGLGATVYDQPGSGETNKISSIVESIGLSNIEEEDYLNHLIKYNTAKVKSIDRALEVLSEEEEKVIKEWYFNGKTADRIGDIIGVTAATVYRIKNQALEYIVISVFGVRDEIKDKR